MSTTVSPSLEKITHQKLSKYTSLQLLSKLESGALMGLSKEVAIVILEKRQIDVKKYKPTTWIKPKMTAVKAEEESEEESPSEQEEITEEPVEEAPKKEKAPKEKKEKQSKKPSFEPINEDDSKVKEILEQEGTKSEKIIALLKEGYSCTQISKSSLKAHYSFCFTLKNKLSEK